VHLSYFNLSVRRLALRALPAALIAVGTAHATPTACVSGEYNDAGTTSCTLPAGVTSVKVEAWGGGGGPSNPQMRIGGGGGGGAYCGATFTVNEGVELTITVGAGGAVEASGLPSSVVGTGISGLVAEAGASSGTATIGGVGGSTASCTASSLSDYPI